MPLCHAVFPRLAGLWQAIRGMYQTFFRDAKVVNPNVRLIGLTATPYRLKSGMLCGPDNLLNEVCYEIGVKELIEQGFLCPLKSKSGRHKVDCDDLHIRAGEFVASEVDALMNTTDNVNAAVREIVTMTRDRHSVLIFAASVDHAQRIKETIERLTSQECGLVTGVFDVIASAFALLSGLVGSVPGLVDRAFESIKCVGSGGDAADHCRAIVA